MIRRALCTSTTLRNTNRDLGFQERDYCQYLLYDWKSLGWGVRARGGKHVFSFKHTVLYVLILAMQSYPKSRSSTIFSQKKFDIHSKTLSRVTFCCLVKSVAESCSSQMSKNGEPTLW